ncbi:MAG: hypothetical protein U0234_32140 [Sandaracinus sp.]
MHLSLDASERRVVATARVLAVAALVVSLAACDSPRPVGFPDAWRSDAGTDEDASEPRDAGLDGAPEDAPAGDDAYVVPGMCEFDAATDFFELDYDLRSDVRRLAVAAGPTSFAVVFSKHDVDDHEDLYFVEIPASGGPPLTTQQLTFDATPDASPVIARTSEGWLVAWLSGRDGNVEVYAWGRSASGWAAVPQRITSTPTIDETTVALASDGARTAIAWAEPGASPVTVALPVDAAGGATAGPVRLSPASVAMIPTSFTTTEDGYLVGWVGPSGDALVQPLSGALATLGDPLVLTAGHDADGTIDAVVSSSGGAAVYGVHPATGRHDVHAHQLGSDGALFHIEQPLTFGDDTGSDAAIAILGGGYVVGYRQSGIEPMLRVLFYDAIFGERLRADLVRMSATGGPISARVSGDGNVLLTWSDLVGSVNHMRVARLRCP